MNIKLKKNLAVLLVAFTPLASAISLSTNNLEFGNQDFLTTSSPKMLTLTNASTKTWERINGFNISNDQFKRASSNCPATLAPKQSCFWNISFAPDDIGVKTGTISIWTSLGSAKVQLSGTGVSQPAAQFGPKKWHPGHYAQFPRNPSSKQLEQVVALPEMKGALLQYDWGVLETAKGVFNFSVIEGNLAVVKGKGKRLAILVNDKGFSGTSLRCVPQDMMTDPLYQGGQYITRDASGNPSGCIAKRWVPAVMDRFIAFHKALGNRFDQEPYVEAVSNEESAVDDAPAADGATTRDYVDQLKRLGSGMADAYPHTLAEIWLNWSVAPYTLELVDYLYRNGIGTGGPDTSPLHLTQIVPEFTSRFAGKMPILMAAQPSFLTWAQQPIATGELTLDDVFHFAVTEAKGINATHMYWWFFKKEWDSRAVYDFYDTVAEIRNHGGLINAACPENLLCDTR
jgi:hypothetical protein